MPHRYRKSDVMSAGERAERQAARREAKQIAPVNVNADALLKDIVVTAEQVAATTRLVDRHAHGDDDRELLLAVLGLGVGA